MKNWKIYAAIAALAFGFATYAGITADQGQGNPNAQEWPINISARRSGKTTEVAVTNAAGGSTVPAAALAGRKAIEIQNLGPNPIYCTVDGTSPVVAKARRIDALGSTAAPAWSLDIGPGVIVKCIAATAAQSTGAATIVSELQ